MNATSQLADELALLARQRASGALDIGGSPGGTVYFSGGYLSYAESAAVPDLGDRLVGSGRMPSGQWRLLAGGGQAPGLGARLVSAGVLTSAELRELLASIALDALIAVAADPAPAGLRFWPRRPHWTGSLLRLDIASVWAEAEQKLAALARHGISAQARPRRCPLSRPAAVIGAGQWAVAWLLDGRATVSDLARQHGLALYQAAERVGDLLEAGLCTLAPAPAIAPAPAFAPAPAIVPAPRIASAPSSSPPPADLPDPAAQGSGEDPPGVPSPPGGPAPLPQRRPGASLAERADRTAAFEVPPWPPGDTQTPPGSPRPDLLRRILKGIRRMG